MTKLMVLKLMGLLFMYKISVKFKHKKRGDFMKSPLLNLRYKLSIISLTSLLDLP